MPCYLRSQKKPTPRLVRWLSEIETYDPVIKYKPGKENHVPDALSRRDGPNCIADPNDIEPSYLYNVQGSDQSNEPHYDQIDLPSEVPEHMRRRVERNPNKYLIRSPLLSSVS
ncbi:hypothetical protein G6F70_009577 [Rhizopus microsporus]|nr:hypothetical protein G6F70_009577 [Rhizopus microsporus]